MLRCPKARQQPGREGGENDENARSNGGRTAGSLRQKTALALAGGGGVFELKPQMRKRRLAFAARALKMPAGGRGEGCDLRSQRGTVWTYSIAISRLPTVERPCGSIGWGGEGGTQRAPTFGFACARKALA